MLIYTGNPTTFKNEYFMKNKHLSMVITHKHNL